MSGSPEGERTGLAPEKFDPAKHSVVDQASVNRLIGELQPLKNSSGPAGAEALKLETLLNIAKDKGFITHGELASLNRAASELGIERKI